MSRVFDFQIEAGQITLPGSGSASTTGDDSHPQAGLLNDDSEALNVGDGVWQMVNLSGNYFGTPAVTVTAVSGSDDNNTVYHPGGNSMLHVRELKYTTGTWSMEIFGEAYTTVSYQVLGKTIDVQR